jgi:hypothetical protein
MKSPNSDPAATKGLYAPLLKNAYNPYNTEKTEEQAHPKPHFTLLNKTV